MYIYVSRHESPFEKNEMGEACSKYVGEEKFI